MEWRPSFEGWSQDPLHIFLSQDADVISHQANQLSLFNASSRPDSIRLSVDMLPEDCLVITMRRTRYRPISSNNETKTSFPDERREHSVVIFASLQYCLCDGVARERCHAISILRRGRPLVL